MIGGGARLDAPFDRVRGGGRRVLIAYLCMGHPTLEESLDLAGVAGDAGADMLELGVPFSDPTADGPASARASERAIAAGASLTRVLDGAARLRSRVDVPFVLFGYYNPILVLGEETTVDRAGQAGIDALLVVDLPPEESGPLRQRA